MHHVEDMRMKPLRGDLAQCFLLFQGVLKGISESYHEDLLRYGNEEFPKLPKLKNDNLQIKEEYELFSYVTGFVLSKKYGSSVVNQI